MVAIGPIQSISVTFLSIRSLYLRAASSWFEHQMMDMPVEPTGITVEQPVMEALLKAGKSRLDPSYLPVFEALEDRFSKLKENNHIYPVINPQPLMKLIDAAVPVLFPDHPDLKTNAR